MWKLVGDLTLMNATTTNECKTTYPDCYLHVEECRTGQTWILPIRGNGLLDLEHQVKRWIKQEFVGERRLDGEIQPRLDGDFYARVMTDGRPPDSVVCWEGGGFWIK